MPVYAPDLYPRKKHGSNLGTHDYYIREQQGIHAKCIATDLRVTERYVISRQRKLGLRPFTGNKPRRNRETRTKATMLGV